jgi:hypothetical protein
LSTFVKPTIALVTPVKYTLLSTVPFAFSEAVPPVVLKPLAFTLPITSNLSVYVPLPPTTT